MARIRTIKPEFWQDDDLAKVSETALIIAVGLLNHADDEGYFKANPKLIESVIFPLREPSVSVPCCLTELSNIGYLKLFKTKTGKNYGYIPGFTSHQVISRKTTSKIKDLINFTEDSVSTHGGLHRERKGKEVELEQGKEQGKEGKGTTSGTPDLALNQQNEIFNFWKATLNHPKSKLDKKRKIKIKASLDIGYSVEDLKSAIRGCSKTPHNMGRNDNGQKYDSIDLIFRSADNIDRFIKNDINPPKVKNKADENLNSNIDSALNAMERME